jgi:hypothetical protein
VPAFFSASHLGIGGGGASGSGNASASGSGSGSGSGIGGSGGGWLGSGIGGSSKVERAEAKYDVTVDCEWSYVSFFLSKCRCGAGLREGKLISFVSVSLLLSFRFDAGRGPISFNSIYIDSMRSAQSDSRRQT